MRELPSAAGRSGSVAAVVPVVAIVAEFLVAASDQPCAAPRLVVGVPQRPAELPANGEPQRQHARLPFPAPESWAFPRSLRRPWPLAPCETAQPAAMQYDCAGLAVKSEPVREGQRTPR